MLVRDRGSGRVRTGCALVRDGGQWESSDGWDARWWLGGGEYLEEARNVLCGLDSAIVVVERKGTMRAFLSPRFDGLQVRFAERVPLGTRYPRVVGRVREILNHPEVAGQCSLTVDGTGVGAPVVNMLRLARLGCEISAVTITGGVREYASPMGGVSGWSVPKLDLITGLQVALETGELGIARRLKEVGSLVRELMDMRATTGEAGRIRLGADGNGEHDDLVIALALACWSAKKKRVGIGTQRLTGISFRKGEYMSVAGYLVPNGPRVCGPEPSGQGALVESDGAVMNGLATPDERAGVDVGDALEAARMEGTPMPGGLIRRKVAGECYGSVDDYDPVLLWHCRL
jgi:hypothetical protein